MAGQTLSIIGLGLLGGSIGLAVKQRLTHFQITGYDQSADVADRAKSMGAIDTIAPSLEAAIAGAETVILCVPPAATVSIFRTLATTARAGTIVTDVLSTKRSIVAAAEAFPSSNYRFLGSHPIAGSEKSGIASARPDLFYNALCVLTPTATDRDNPNAIGPVSRFWEALGMRVVEMSPDEHDRAFAAVSHLPHALAAALVNQTPETLARLAGKGFLDTTRIAAGNPALWQEILLDNADHVGAGLRKLSDELRALAAILESKDAERLLSYLAQAAEARRVLGERITAPPK